MHKKIVAVVLSVGLISGTGIVRASGASTNPKVAAAAKAAAAKAAAAKAAAAKAMATRAASAKAALLADESMVNDYNAISAAQISVANMYKAIAVSPVTIAADAASAAVVAAIVAQRNKTGQTLAAQSLAGDFAAAAKDFNAFIGSNYAVAAIDYPALLTGSATAPANSAVAAAYAVLPAAQENQNATETAYIKAMGSSFSAAEDKAWQFAKHVMEVASAAISAKSADARAALAAAQRAVSKQQTVVGLANLYGDWAAADAISCAAEATAWQSWVAFYNADIKALAAKTPAAADATWAAYYNAGH